MMRFFYSTGTFKKKRYATYLASFGRNQRIEHRVWMGEFEPEPTKIKSSKGQIWFDEASKLEVFTNKLPDKFKPKPAYKGAR
jgi:hypothetical protein